ncbi:hypothetical protein CEXT_441901 [Caerostris extrusa]|uniref:Uncharacterized protein n=1 Tax=Caerostris extrusa TaxID=172846 RepID=A0AAV4Y4Z3_CAEEX|nr:hypothetical protein CEXT_441901 [Caerostris extrusa]
MPQFFHLTIHNQHRMPIFTLHTVTPLSCSEEWHTFDYLWHLEKGASSVSRDTKHDTCGVLEASLKNESVTCAHPSSRELDYYKSMFPMCSDEGITVMSG